MRKLLLNTLFFLGLVSCKSPDVESRSYHLMLQSILDDTVPVLSVAQLKDNKNIMLLDARQQEEFDVSHIPNASYVGFEDFDLASLMHLDKHQPIVVYCSVGYRSEKITRQLLDNGFEDVRNLYGGIFEWVNQGNEVVDTQGQKTSRIHPYSSTWGIWLREGEKAYQ